MSNDQSSGIEVIIISVYDLDGKGQIRYGPGHLEAWEPTLVEGRSWGHRANDLSKLEESAAYRWLIHCEAWNVLEHSLGCGGCTE